MKLDLIMRKARPILRQQGIRRAGLFGSAARGQMEKDSDIDLLVDIKGSASLLSIIHLKHELEDALHRKVDIVEYGAIKPALRSRILKEEVALL